MDKDKARRSDYRDMKMEMKKMKLKAVQKNYMYMIPVQSKERPWKKSENGMVVIDMENKGFYYFISQKFFKKPRISHISLDKYGTVVWQNINGENTVGDIVEIMKQEFSDEQERMLDRVVTYMATLQTHKFITMK